MGIYCINGALSKLNCYALYCCTFEEEPFVDQSACVQEWYVSEGPRLDSWPSLQEIINNLRTDLLYFG